MFCFFLDFYRVFLLGSLTSSSGKYIHIPRGLDRIFISISISHAATVLLLVLVVLLVVLVVVLLTIII